MASPRIRSYLLLILLILPIPPQSLFIKFSLNALLSILLPAEILTAGGENILNPSKVPITVCRLRDAFAHKVGEIWKSIFCETAEIEK